MPKDAGCIYRKLGNFEEGHAPIVVVVREVKGIDPVFVTTLLSALLALGGGVITWLVHERQRYKRAYAELVGLVLENAELSGQTRKDLGSILRRGEL